MCSLPGQRYIRAATAPRRQRPVTHLFLMKNVTPNLYFFTSFPNADSNAMRNLVENCLGFSPGATISLGLRSRAHNAGDNVRELIADRPTDTAMVRPNCL